MTKLNKKPPIVSKYKAVRRVYDKALENLREGDMPERAIHRALGELQCPQCHGLGKFDDAEPGDIGCNEYHCDLCRRTGVALNAS